MSEFKAGEQVKYRFKNGVATFVYYGAISPRNSFIKFAGDKDNTMVLSHHLTRIDNDMGDDFSIENRISPLCKSKDV
ncbi:TPA: hypothetical protein ACSB4L_003516 [Acinetobacter baumannii]|uniref:hypothetical protein n=1 Tax=Acinetobacter baumannii TaxID=470 RepID=UPI001CDCC37B|nr:hypothetical protein [Acinetobacter baumannii]MCA4278420.1 hypothetical protein [Acinetobacter baumannii]